MLAGRGILWRNSLTVAKRSKSIDRVEQALAALGVNAVPLELGQSARTAQLAADALGVPLGSIAKSLVFIAGERPVLALVAGDRRADTAKIAAACGCSSARLASADEVRAHTGFAVGGVPPVGHLRTMPVLLDESLARFELLHAAAGAPQAVFPITLAELLRITGATQADIVEAE